MTGPFSFGPGLAGIGPTLLRTPTSAAAAVPGNAPDHGADEGVNVSEAADPAGAGQAPTGRPEPQFDNIGVLGHAGWLMSRSEEHRDGFLADLEWRVMAPVALGQFRLWRNGHMPVAFATWAYVDDRVAERLERGVKKLAPSEWKCGEKPVLVDLIAPFGGREQAMEELKEIIS